MMILTKEELAQKRKKAGLSYSQLAEITGYSRSYLCNLEKGQKEIHPHMSRILRAYFDRGEIIKPVKIAHHRNSKGRFARG